MDRNAFFWQIQDGKLPPPRCAQTLGIRIVKVDPETGTLEAEFEGKEAFLNPAGNIQGGFLAAMLDDTMGPALSATLAAGEFSPTLSLNVQFLSPAKPGLLQSVGLSRPTSYQTPTKARPTLVVPLCCTGVPVSE